MSPFEKILRNSKGIKLECLVHVSATEIEISCPEHKNITNILYVTMKLPLLVIYIKTHCVSVQS